PGRAPGAGGGPVAPARRWRARRTPAPDPALAGRVVPAAAGAGGRRLRRGCTDAAVRLRTAPGPGRMLRPRGIDLGTPALAAAQAAGGTAPGTGGGPGRPAGARAGRAVVRAARDRATPGKRALPAAAGAAGGMAGGPLRPAAEPAYRCGDPLPRAGRVAAVRGLRRRGQDLSAACSQRAAARPARRPLAKQAVSR